MHYLDGFLLLGPPGLNECQTSLNIIVKCCETLGIPLALEKVEGPYTSLSFCQSINHTPMPTSELTLLLFMAHLAQNKSSHSTIRVYFSAIRNLHLTSGLLYVAIQYSVNSPPSTSITRNQKISSSHHVTHYPLANHHPDYAEPKSII